MLLDSPASSHEVWRVHGANWIDRLGSGGARGTPPTPSRVFVPGPAHLSGKVRYLPYLPPWPWTPPVPPPHGVQPRQSGKGSSCSHFHNPTHELSSPRSCRLSKICLDPSLVLLLPASISLGSSRAASRDQGRRTVAVRRWIIRHKLDPVLSKSPDILDHHRALAALHDTATAQFSITGTFVHWQAVLKHELRLGTSIVPAGLPWGGESPDSSTIINGLRLPTDATHYF